MRRKKKLFKNIEKILDEVVTSGRLGREDCEKLRKAEKELRHAESVRDKLGMSKATNRLLQLLVKLHRDRPDHPTDEQNQRMSDL